LRILQSYLGTDFTDERVASSFTIVYELLDETLDYGRILKAAGVYSNIVWICCAGYPQNCSIDVLKLYINLGSVLQSLGAATGTSLTSQITGAIDWRREGIRYRKNEVEIDVIENISLTTSATGQLLHSEVQGRVMMKTQLTGMPECKFGLNDKLIMEKEVQFLKGFIFGCTCCLTTTDYRGVVESPVV
jgi:AP-2 complex subunit mu-1